MRILKIESLAATCLRSYATAPAHADTVERPRLRHLDWRDIAAMGGMRLGLGSLVPFVDANSVGEVRLEQRDFNGIPAAPTMRKAATKRGATGPSPWRQPV